MSSASWLSVRGISNSALGKYVGERNSKKRKCNNYHRYRVFASRVREEAGASHVRQLSVLTARLFNQEILPLDYALCATVMFLFTREIPY
jgi:hypothetical protein